MVWERGGVHIAAWAGVEMSLGRHVTICTSHNITLSDRGVHRTHAKPARASTYFSFLWRVSIWGQSYDSGNELPPAMGSEIEGSLEKY